MLIGTGLLLGVTAVAGAEMLASPQQGDTDSICPPSQSSGGSVSTLLQVLSRKSGVSPETVYFSAQQTTDPACVDFSGENDQEACRTGQYLGYHFDFDDPDSGVFSTTGNSKNQQVSGAPRAVHTYSCEGPGNSRWNPVSQQCEFAVRVRAQNPAGDWDDACVGVAIAAQADVYSPAQTYCISSDSDFSACPAGVPPANQLIDSPTQAVQGNLSQSRILYQRGSSGVYAPICVDYGERDIRIDAYGEGADPVVSSLAVGVANGCNDGIPTTAQLNSYDPLTRDASADIVAGWAYGVSAANLRLGSIDTGMSATLLTLHNLDLDWSAGGGLFSAEVQMGSAGQNCYENDAIDCALVHHPYGIFVSEVRSVGNANGGLLPRVNFFCFRDCGLINSAIIGSYGKVAFEHTARVMGAWGLVVSNSHFAGDHIGGNGGKSKLTLRQVESDVASSQVADPENFVSGNHAGNGPGWERNSDLTRHFSPHYNFVIDNVFGDITQNDATETAGWLEIDPGHQYSGVFGSTFLVWPGADTNSSQLALGGRNIAVIDTAFNNNNTTCRFRSSFALPEPGYYNDFDTIFTDTPDARCNGADRNLPMPDQPGGGELFFIDGFES